MSENLLKEAQVAERLASPLTRLAGVCTLCALLGWAYGGLWSWEFIRQPLLLSNASRLFGHMMEMQNDSNGGQDFEVEAPPPGNKDADDLVAEEATALEEGRPAATMSEPTVLSPADRERAFAKEFNQYLAVQGATTVIWSVVMILAGVFLLCAALSGLSGSHRARKWHRQVVYWTFFATVCTVGGMWALVQWGGFPPIPNPWILAKIGAVQSSYAIAIIVALIATHRRAVTH